MKYFRFIILSFLFLSASTALYALDLVNIFRHSVVAGKNSVFVDVGLAPLDFENWDFPIVPIDIRLEYMLPLPLPFSAGFFLKMPNPNLKSFGTRLSYHFDLLDDFTDFYVVYSYDFGYFRNDILLEYNDTEVEPLYYDFRLGIRRFFNRWVGIAIESGPKFQSIIFMLSVKIN